MEDARPDIKSFPLMIEFAKGSRLTRDEPYNPRLPIVRNGPPGTFVVLPDETRVPLPSDQIVYADDTSGRVRIGFGGMRSAGMEGEQLVFYRFKDLEPAEKLSPQRGVRMTLEPSMVAKIWADGFEVWPH